jgi:hypothetical protein
MSVVYTKITLENPADAAKAREGIIAKSAIRRVTVDALVDTGAWSLVINEETREQLGLYIEKTGTVEAAGGIVEPCGVTEPVTVRWRDRIVACNALVLPDEKDVLLGALPFRGLDLMVHSRLEKVIGAHGAEVKRMVK